MGDHEGMAGALSDAYARPLCYGGTWEISLRECGDGGRSGVFAYALRWSEDACFVELTEKGASKGLVGVWTSSGLCRFDFPNGTRENKDGFSLADFVHSFTGVTFRFAQWVPGVFVRGAELCPDLPCAVVKSADAFSANLATVRKDGCLAWVCEAGELCGFAVRIGKSLMTARCCDQWHMG